MIRRTIFTAVPWFLMDIATYGVGIFTPTLLAAIALAGPDATFLSDDIASTEGTAALDIFLVFGFASAILLVERVGRMRAAADRLRDDGGRRSAILGGAEGLPGGGDAPPGDWC